MIYENLLINGVDFSDDLSTYEVTIAPVYSSVIQTMDGLEHTAKRADIYTINFSLLPMVGDTAKTHRTALADGIFYVTFTDPYNGNESVTKKMRVTTDLSASFGLKSATGDIYYKGGTITLRETA